MGGGAGVGVGAGAVGVGVGEEGGGTGFGVGAGAGGGFGAGVGGFEDGALGAPVGDELALGLVGVELPGEVGDELNARFAGRPVPQPTNSAAAETSKMHEFDLGHRSNDINVSKRRNVFKERLKRHQFWSYQV
ncbi:MAG TPA: hypothetical protein VFQ00_10335 [Terriglobales bacterium]|nr:hypothetical protein [Terriglobales bacterium]